MNIITKTRVGISKYLIKKQQKKLNRQIEVCNIHKAQNALIVGNISNEEGIKAIQKMKAFFAERNLNCEVIGYSNKKNASNLISDTKHHYLTNDNFSYFYIPKLVEVKTVLNKSHDVLVNLYEEHSYQIESVVKLSNAKFKVGCSSFEADTHDLLLNIKETQKDPLFITEQMQHYITIINS
ncbi:DUF6913 domain-containing protein [Saccharicrinis aurantiacus]|uniref:DUF6913 domain-containing protein n=1 Tax=Saccharicrinis aurantiacus TaxID=1849719 RepID=UPI00094FDBAB|nr:hypothetical protein [Saccharicrinis aurantiacus]